MRSFRSLVLGALFFLPSVASPQGNPVGPEFRVNTYTPGNQWVPAVAASPSGSFVVVWASPAQDGSDHGIYGQRFAGPLPVGPEFRINTYTTGEQLWPAVAIDASGNFVVAWHSVQDGSDRGVFGQRYAATGAPLGPEFRVNTFTIQDQRHPSVATDALGNFVVVWHSQQDGSGEGVFGQRYDSAGSPLGPEFRVNTYTTLNQSYASVAADPSGGFVVVWHSAGQDGAGFGVYGQRYASSGSPIGPEFRVNTFTTSWQVSTEVAVDDAGNFIVTWIGFDQDGSNEGVFAQRYASTGIPVGPEFQVNTFIPNIQAFPDAAYDAAGNFVIVWQSLGQDGSDFGVYGQRYASTGAPSGPEFRVNTLTDQGQEFQAVASDAAGNFLVVWAGLGTTFTQDVLGQRYSQIVPVELLHFTLE